MAQRCPSPPMVNLISFGGQHQGTKRSFIDLHEASTYIFFLHRLPVKKCIVLDNRFRCWKLFRFWWNEQNEDHNNVFVWHIIFTASWTRVFIPGWQLYLQLLHKLNQWGNQSISLYLKLYPAAGFIFFDYRCVWVPSMPWWTFNFMRLYEKTVEPWCLHWLCPETFSTSPVLARSSRWGGV